MKSRYVLLATAGVLALGGIAAAGQAQGKKIGPVAQYWMTAETGAGINMQGGPSAMMNAMMRGGNPAAANHLLRLRLGSTRKAAGTPQAEHLPPAGLGAGASLPLAYVPSGSSTSGRQPWEKPSGKISIYWGCGDHAGAGQPVVIDLAKIGPTGVPALLGGVMFKTPSYPSPSSAGYGEWPNAKSRTSVPGEGSLVGEHVVRGNYAPEIRFSLDRSQDFMAPLTITRNAKAASGAVQVAWQPLPNARAYFATAVGEARDGSVVMWSSSGAKTAVMGMVDFLEAGEISRLVAEKALMGPQQTQCAVPAEVARALPEGMFGLTAFGPEANFSYPPKPASPNAPWNLEWTVKLLTKSSNMGMLGMSMEDMMGGAEGMGSGDTEEQSQDEKPKKGLFKKGIGGLLKKAL